MDVYIFVWRHGTRVDIFRGYRPDPVSYMIERYPEMEPGLAFQEAVKHFQAPDNSWVTVYWGNQ